MIATLAGSALAMAVSARPAAWSARVGSMAPRVSGQATTVDENGRIVSQLHSRARPFPALRLVPTDAGAIARRAAALWRSDRFGRVTAASRPSRPRATTSPSRRRACLHSSPTTNELWAYEGDEWRQLATAGEGPGPRMYAASAVLGRSLYLFGGWDPEAPGSGGSFKDEVWALDLYSMEWSKREPMPCGPTSRHTACTVGDQIIIHTFRGIYVCDGGALREQPTSGDAPDGLSMCVAAALGDNTLLVVGGATREQAMSADARVLDTRTWEWTKLTPAGAAPSPRASACAASLGDGAAVVFGGAGLGGQGYDGGGGLVAMPETWTVHVDGGKAQWAQIETDDTPPPRVAASLSPLPAGGFLLAGGWDPQTKETHAEPYVFTRG